MDHQFHTDNLTDAAEQVRRQRAVVVTLAKAKRFNELPAAHQILRQMEDALKLERASRPAMD
jgi:hypothetical protein